ncbi:DUF1592 domain-containing protein [Phragmitibacter flavus]|uniref:DUF1592 domain-containing protein n=1 Tax=Phragmitibacter flavus TaxID=2576071 RepID=A0A5R8KAZ6_9BACT|nr:DUF1592 domain-containing protein [Phragmitibacter flavus]
MKLRRLVTFVVVSLSSVGMAMVKPVFAAGELRGHQTFEKSVLPVLQTFCYDCHGDGMDKGDFAMDGHKDYAEALSDKKMWDHVREIMSTHVMPPEDKDQPTLEERKLVLKWIEDEVFWVDPTKPDPGHVTLRRMNRTEYNNTVRDVLKVNSRPARNFPPDDTGYGYDNIGSVLSLSPMLMEKYLRSAREVAAEAVWVRPAGRFEDELSGDEFKVSSGSGSERYGMMALFGNGEMVGTTEIKEPGLYRVTLLLSSNKSGDENAKYAVLVDGKEVFNGEVEKEFDGKDIDGSLERVAFDLNLEKGKRSLAVRFLNDHFDDNAPDKHRRDRNLLLRSAHVEGPIKMKAVAQSPFLEWLMQGKKISPAQLEIQGDDFEKLDGGGVFLQNKRAVFASNGSVKREFELPSDGEYRVMLVANANQAGDERARLSVKVGDEVRTLDITEPDGKNQTLSFTTKKLKAGKNTIVVGFVNDFYLNGKDRNAYLEEVYIVGPTGSETAQVFEPAFAREWISRMGLKMFRRPVEAGDLNKLMGLVVMAQKEGASRQEAISLVLEAMMGSSKFLFNGAPDVAGPVGKGSALVNEFTLASRLSYFIWSSAPDDQLLELAGKGQLRANLKAEVKRMIGDWKGWALTENFAGQWLRLRDIELMSPHQRRFPEFYKGSLRRDMKKESELFFDHILRDNRSALEILDSDYTFMNETLAKFYGVEGVKGSKFQKVSLKGTPRGGLLTQAGILALTSHPTRTSPVKRGQFLLENVLGTPPPPAPQNIPEFGEDRGAKVEGTLRQRFEAHRANPSCSSCHAFLDPFGFAFENFDAIGRWRDQDNKEAVDATGKLLTGEKFNGAAELRKLLVDLKRDDFTRTLIENLLIYSLGRGLDYPDKLFVRQLKEKAAEGEYRLQDLIVSVVESVPFQKMRATVAAAPAPAAPTPATPSAPVTPAAPKQETAQK